MHSGTTRVKIYFMSEYILCTHVHPVYFVDNSKFILVITKKRCTVLYFSDCIKKLSPEILYRSWEKIQLGSLWTTPKRLVFVILLIILAGSVLPVYGKITKHVEPPRLPASCLASSL